MEEFIPSLTKSMRASVRPRHEWQLCFADMARAELLQNAVLWRGGAEGLQNSAWCSGVKQGISVCFTTRARCSSLCSGSSQQQCTVESCKSSWITWGRVYTDLRGSFLCWMKTRAQVMCWWSRSTTWTTPLRYHLHCGIIRWDQMQWCWVREGAEQSCHTSESVCISPNWDHPWAWIVKSGSANTLLLPMLCSQQFCEYP